MAVEDFTTYTEEDPNTRITVISTRATFASLTTGEDAYVYKDKGSNHFSGNFTHYQTVRWTASDASGITYTWGLTNTVDDMNGIYLGSGDYLGVYMYRSGTNNDLYLEESDGGDAYNDSYRGITFNVDYYLTIVRDETIGTYGTAYCFIYSDANRKTLVDTLTVALHTSKKDYRYIFCLNTANSGGALTQSGYSDSLNLNEGVTYPATAITRVTNLIHYYNRVEGIYRLEMNLGEVTSDFGLPTNKFGPNRSTPDEDEKEETKRVVAETIKAIKKTVVPPIVPSEMEFTTTEKEAKEVIESFATSVSGVVGKITGYEGVSAKVTPPSPLAQKALTEKITPAISVVQVTERTKKILEEQAEAAAAVTKRIEEAKKEWWEFWK